jgi:hypothetical protein
LNGQLLGKFWLLPVNRINKIWHMYISN